MSRPRRPLLSAVAVLAGSLALPLAPVTAASAATGAAPDAAPVAAPVTAPVAPRCDKPLLAEPKRAARVEADAPATFATAARRNDESIADFAAVAEDRTLWLDECGKGFFVEPRRDAGETPTVADATVDNPDAHLPAGVDPLSLESRPGAPRTLYLDFDGETVVGTGWNASRNLPEIVAPPYSITAPADTNFSSDERDQIYRAWLTVAEDYAPFDINVTTQHPGTAALARTDSSDQSYGTRVVIGEVDSLYDICTCGGQAYIDVFDTTGAAHDYYQPAWVYTHSMADDGWSIGQAASHEVGHNFGLRHDGQGSTPYYRGTNSWAPIMGVSYYSVLAQWSQGTYAGATNTEDDLALIAGGAPLLADDHGDTAATATSVDGAEPVAGLITTRTDRDAFTFTAGGPTRFSAYADTQDTNLDLDLTVLDDTGTPIEVADPSLLGDEQAHPTPDALSATWVADLPAERRTYTVLVDGGDNQGFVVSQPYDDYGSLGRYRVALDTAPGPGDPDPLALTPSGDLVATEGDPVDASPATVTGGVAPYTWTAAGLPSGLTLDAATGRVTGAFDHEVDGYLTLTVRDARGAWRSVEVRYVVAAGESLVVLDSDWTFEEGTPVEDTLLVATGALSTPTWSVHAGQVPPGLTLGSGGSLTGTPTAPGDFTFTAQARTARSTALATVRVAVRAAYVAPPAPPTLPPVLVPPPTTTAPPPTVSPPTTTPVRIATRSLPKAKVRRAYQATVALQRAVPGTVWKVTKGKLPPGVTMRISADRSKAILTGKPKVKGTFTFRLTARAGSSRSARILEIQVR